MAVKRFCDVCDQPCPEPTERNGHATWVEIPFRFPKLGNVKVRYSCYAVVNTEEFRKDLCPSCAEKAISSVVVRPTTDYDEARQTGPVKESGIAENF